MGPAVQLSGRVALFAGLVALSITAGCVWFYLQFGSPLDVRFMRLLESGERLAGFVFLALLFQYGLPFLCMGAFLFGVPARRCWTARIGMAAAGVSLIAYLRYLWLFYRIVSNP